MRGKLLYFYNDECKAATTNYSEEKTNNILDI